VFSFSRRNIYSKGGYLVTRAGLFALLEQPRADERVVVACSRVEDPFPEKGEIGGIGQREG